MQSDTHSLATHSAAVHNDTNELEPRSETRRRPSEIPTVPAPRLSPSQSRLHSASLAMEQAFRRQREEAERMARTAELLGLEGGL